MAKCYILTNSVVRTWGFIILLLGILGIVLTIYCYIKSVTKLAGLKQEFMTVSQCSRYDRAHRQFSRNIWLFWKRLTLLQSLELQLDGNWGCGSLQVWLSWRWRPPVASHRWHSIQDPWGRWRLTDPSLPCPLLYYLLSLGSPTTPWSQDSQTFSHGNWLLWD